MGRNSADEVSASGEGSTVAAVVHLSGSRRGRSEPLTAKTLRIDRLSAGGVRFVRPDASYSVDHVATLHRAGESYELEVHRGHDVWVNGDKVGSRILQSGDLIEVGHGPVMRFRLYPEGVPAHKSVAEVLGDCVDCARHDGRPLAGKAPGLFLDMLRSLATQTSLVFRGAMIVTMLGLASIITYQFFQTRDLEQRLAQEQQRIAGLAELLTRAEQRALTREELMALRTELQQGMVQTEQRVSALEARSAAARRIIAEYAPSVVFIQGSYGFQDPETGRPLRLVLGDDESPIRVAGGRPLITLEGDGPPVEVNYTGTAFIVHADGLLLTNRHVALPWEEDDALSGIEALGLEPTMRRMLGYLSGVGESFDVTLLAASDEADLAVLSCGAITRLRRPLKMAATPVEPGAEVLLLGYPTGVRALLARAGARFVAQLGDLSELDFWTVARELAEAGLITPLASRGIVGQVTPDAVVYDAETTHGGSGGPVLSFNGETVAVNSAIIPEFGGSNLGAPIAHARNLLAELDPARPD